MSLKRITAFVLCFILAMALIAPASADDVDIEISNESTRNVTVLYEEPETFSFNIAPSITLTKDANNNLSGSSLITLSANMLSTSTLSVSVTGDYGAFYDGASPNRWRLIGGGSSILYTINSEASGNIVTPIKSGDVLFTLSGQSGNEVSDSRVLNFGALASENPNIVPANYQGTLTFVIRKTS